MNWLVRSPDFHKLVSQRDCLALKYDLQFNGSLLGLQLANNQLKVFSYISFPGYWQRQKGTCRKIRFSVQFNLSFTDIDSYSHWDILKKICSMLLVFSGLSTFLTQPYIFSHNYSASCVSVALVLFFDNGRGACQRARQQKPNSTPNENIFQLL